MNFVRVLERNVMLPWEQPRTISQRIALKWTQESIAWWLYKQFDLKSYLKGTSATPRGWSLLVDYLSVNLGMPNSCLLWLDMIKCKRQSACMFAQAIKVQCNVMQCNVKLGSMLNTGEKHMNNQKWTITNVNSDQQTRPINNIGVHICVHQKSQKQLPLWCNFACGICVVQKSEFSYNIFLRRILISW